MTPDDNTGITTLGNCAILFCVGFMWDTVASIDVFSTARTFAEVAAVISAYNTVVAFVVSPRILKVRVGESLKVEWKPLLALAIGGATGTWVTLSLIRLFGF